MPLMPTPRDPAAAPDLSATLASGRWLIWLLAVPVLALLAFLMAAQVRQQRSAAESAIERRHEERVRTLHNRRGRRSTMSTTCACAWNRCGRIRRRSTARWPRR